MPILKDKFDEMKMRLRELSEHRAEKRANEKELRQALAGAPREVRQCVKMVFQAQENCFYLASTINKQALQEARQTAENVLGFRPDAIVALDKVLESRKVKQIDSYGQRSLDNAAFRGAHSDFHHLMRRFEAYCKEDKVKYNVDKTIDKFYDVYNLLSKAPTLHRPDYDKFKQDTLDAMDKAGVHRNVAKQVFAGMETLLRSANKNYDFYKTAEEKAAARTKPIPPPRNLNSEIQRRAQEKQKYQPPNSGLVNNSVLRNGPKEKEEEPIQQRNNRPGSR